MPDPISQLWPMLIQLAPEIDVAGLRASLATAADIVRESSRIIVCGTGKSKLVADRLAANLRLMGCESFAFSAAELPHGDFGAFGNGSMGVFISSSGQDAHVINAARRVCVEFAMAGIAITNATHSDLGATCNLTLTSGTNEDIFGPYPPLLNFYRLSVLGDLLLGTVVARDLPTHSAKSHRNHR